MLVVVPKEIKNNENRVAITPAGVHALVNDGHKVLIERLAGSGSGITDTDYSSSGANVVDNTIDLYNAAVE
jgi:alanine dehydrogenase